jgi:hypothetical protein
MDQERLDAILYTAAIIVALITVRRVMRRSKRPAVVAKLKTNDAEIARRLQVLESLLEQAIDP